MAEPPMGNDSNAGTAADERILAYGRPDQIAWARRRVGDQQIRRWSRERKGRGLLPAQVALWVSKKTSRRWLAADPIARIWAER